LPHFARVTNSPVKAGAVYHTADLVPDPSLGAGCQLRDRNSIRFKACDNGRSRRGARNMLKLRSIGLSEFAVFEGRQRIGGIRFVIEPAG